MLPIITQNGHTIHAIFDFLLIGHTTLCSNIWQSTFPRQQLLDVLYMAGGSTLKLETGYCVEYGNKLPKQKNALHYFLW